MIYHAYIDESGLTKNDRCYSIGAVIFPKQDEPELLKLISRLRDRYNFTNEIKWTKVHMKSPNLIDLGLEFLYTILEKPIYYHSIVVNKALYKNWKINVDEAFYTSFTQLISHMSAQFSAEFMIYADEKSDKYPKHHEVCQLIANRYLCNRDSQSNIKEICKVNSKDNPIIQCCDFITGAITTSHNIALNQNHRVNDGKKLCIKKLAEIIGWDDLSYDTWKNEEFNIWHFPTEFRGKPHQSKNFNKQDVTSPSYLNPKLHK